MSEKRSEEENESEFVKHWSHDEHSLTLVKAHRGVECYGCEQRFSDGEQAYGCKVTNCGYAKLLHEECLEMPRKIRHIRLHPQHILIQSHPRLLKLRCFVCEWRIHSIGYYCTSSGCEFQIHMKCVEGGYVRDDDDDGDEQSRSAIDHPSHPNHKLMLMTRTKASCSFKCDACGRIEKGNSYVCSVKNCQYWIHQECALLRDPIKSEYHEDHPLSLSFHVPYEYMKYGFKCEACNKCFTPKYWIYHCQLCSCAIHIKCALDKSPHVARKGNDEDTKEKVMKFPLNIDHVVEGQIEAFVAGRRERGAIPILRDDLQDYKFHNHKLGLVSLSSSSLSSSSNGWPEEEENSDSDDEGDYRRKSELICNGCVTPISLKHRSCSSSSYEYMSCSREDCKYNLHMACFHLPPQIQDLPVHFENNHHLILQSSHNLHLECYCNICKHDSDGLYYSCTRCSFTADIKCATMPTTISHEAHPQHPLNFFTETKASLICDAGCGHPLQDYRYECNICDFTVHARCAMLPASVRSRRWDKHHLHLPLTYNANLNHPGDFYCNQCEEMMNKKSWMYHCAHCDISFHPTCFPLTSGAYRNIKFGQKYRIPEAHHHTLTYQLLSTKHRCDCCQGDAVGQMGFHCEQCNFFVCFNYCAWTMDSEPLDSP